MNYKKLTEKQKLKNKERRICRTIAKNMKILKTGSCATEEIPGENNCMYCFWNRRTESCSKRCSECKIQECENLPDMDCSLVSDEVLSYIKKKLDQLVRQSLDSNLGGC